MANQYAISKIMSKKQSGMSAGAMVGIGASVAALSAAAYVLFGPDGKKNRKAIRSWAVKMKGEIIEKFEEAKEITEPMYHKIIDDVKAKYSEMPNINKEELEAVVAEVRKHWKTMMKDAKPKTKKSKVKNKKVKAKKTTKKTKKGKK